MEVKSIKLNSFFVDKNWLSSPLHRYFQPTLLNEYTWYILRIIKSIDYKYKLYVHLSNRNSKENENKIAAGKWYEKISDR